LFTNLDKCDKNRRSIALPEKTSKCRTSKTDTDFDYQISTSAMSTMLATERKIGYTAGNP